MNKALRSELSNLSASERLELAIQLWDSLSERDLPPASDEQIALAERRLAEHRARPESAIGIEDLRRALHLRGE